MLKTFFAAAAAVAFAGASGASIAQDLAFGIISTEASQNLKLDWQPVLDDMAPQFALPMCRTLYRPPRNPVLESGVVEAGDAALDLTALFAHSTVDEQVLRAHIDAVLRGRAQVTLAEVTAAYPPEHGLAEIVAYLRIASMDDAATVDETVIETVDLPARDDGPGKRVRLPRVIFAG